MQQLKEDLRIVLGKDIPEELDEILDRVVRLYHKRTNGPISFDTACLLTTLYYSDLLNIPKKSTASSNSK
tara:strand:+ start:140 stop:349 length:210 start_codon:yes stop_codon:yes gene_type:complete